MQRFYIVPYPVAISIIQVSVEDENTLRTNKDMTKAVVKLPVGDQTEYPQLENYEPYTKEQILYILTGEEWQDF
jgi:hypothetical protein